MRTARGLAGLFEFEEFEDNFDILFRHAPTLRVAADFNRYAHSAKPLFLLTAKLLTAKC